MKSNQVIFGNLSYSETINEILIKETNNTVYSWISEENVHYGNVVFIGIVVSAILKQGWL